MVVIGSCGSWNAKDFPHWVDYLSYKNIDNLPWMREQQTSELQIRTILDQIINYNIAVSDEEMKSIKTSTLFALGDQDDATSLKCIEQARKNLPSSFLWILPDTGHGAHKDKNKNDFVRVSKEFFSRKMVQLILCIYLNTLFRSFNHSVKLSTQLRSGQTAGTGMMPMIILLFWRNYLCILYSDSRIK
jgi:hypothetical protein